MGIGDLHRFPITVLGAGAWGTALAVHLARNGNPVTLWAHRAEHARQMARERENRRYLPGIPLPDNLQPAAELAQAVAGERLLLVVVPSHAFRETLRAVQPLLEDHHCLAWGTKGMEYGSHKLLHQVVAEELGDGIPAACISGPTFAAEVARGLPSALTVASRNVEFARRVALLLHGPTFRAYISEDIIGVELGGALKNVLAIAAGIADGLGLGANTRAALITRGLAELMRLGVVMGGQRETFMGLAGLGDLVLTCTDDQSRNRRFGKALGRGESRDQAVAGIGQVVEGIHSAAEARALSQMHQVEMPIAEQVYRVLYEGADPHAAVRHLLDRDIKPEI